MTELQKAVKHLLNRELDACHEIAQRNEGPDGNYLHAILHRQEGDFDNSLYWYRRVGSHPVLQQMAKKFPSWTFESQVSQARNPSQHPDFEKQEEEEIRLMALHLEAVPEPLSSTDRA